MTIKKPYISIIALFGVFLATGMTLILATPLSAQPNASTPNPSQYSDLLAQSRAMSPAQRNQALDLFKTGLELWKSGDFASALLAFKQGLDIDPANGPANYYYGDCLQRQGRIASAANYFTRAATLGGASAEAFKAQTALQSIPRAPAAELSEVFLMAQTYAEFAVMDSSIDSVRLHLHYALNCLVGPEGDGFDASHGNPCAHSGIGADAVDERDASKRAALLIAIGQAKHGIADNDIKTAQRDAASVDDAIAKLK